MFSLEYGYCGWVLYILAAMYTLCDRWIKTSLCWAGPSSAWSGTQFFVGLEITFTTVMSLAWTDKNFPFYFSVALCKIETSMGDWLGGLITTSFSYLSGGWVGCSVPDRAFCRSPLPHSELSNIITAQQQPQPQQQNNNNCSWVETK